ncbi:hypothetical protein AVEN_143469-1 [Araneus ventricosus]|uniref:Uncharacterized protein n=1 Tax=Araneus ventricosus TaxID=182803 RepID=A0A4Y2M0E9_ARAVE|nr:hypothetical protein AVEN_143469-1 [Araneus ventricosus]
MGTLYLVNPFPFLKWLTKAHRGIFSSGSRGGLVAQPPLGDRRLADSKLDSTEDSWCIRCGALHFIEGHTSFHCCGAEAWRGSASSDVVI